MRKAQTERNRLIASLYDPERRNGPALAARFGISPGRVSQIIKEYKGKQQMAKYTDRIPVVQVEPGTREAMQAIADSFDVAFSVVVRWAVKDFIEKHAARIAPKVLGVETSDVIAGNE